MKQIFVGIDFSLNSTGICIEIDDKDYYFNFFNDTKFGSHKKKNFHLGDFLLENKIYYDLFKNIDNLRVIIRSQEPLSKPKDVGINKWGQWHFGVLEIYTDLIVNTIYSFIQEMVSEPFKVITSIENYSYNSFGDATIQIIEMTSVLKHKLTKKSFLCSLDDLHIFPGPNIKKKFTGNGNAIKYDMFEAFLAFKRKSQDSFLDYLVANKLQCYKEKYKIIKETKKKPEHEIPNHEMLSPIDDIIDAFFIKEYGKITIK